MTGPRSVRPKRNERVPASEEEDLSAIPWQALIDRTAISIKILQRLQVRSPVPWPSVREETSGRLRRVGDFYFALWNVAVAAVESSALNKRDWREGMQACERLRWVAHAFGAIEEAERAPTPENLATLIFSGARMNHFDAAAPHPNDLLWAPESRLGRPKGTGYDAADAELVQQASHRILAGEDATEVWTDVAQRAAGGGTHESRVRRLKRRLRDFK